MTPQATLDDRGDLLAGILARDPALEGEVFFGVTTTGVFCRPTCPARRPREERIRLFATREEAARAGFRACLRCRPDQEGPWRRGDDVAERTATLLRRRPSQRLDLDRLAAEVGSTASKLRPAFRRRFGQTPAAYLEDLRLDRVRQALRHGATVRRAAREAGYRSPSRLYERGRFGMTPGTFQRGGQGEEIRYVTAPTPLGTLLVAATARGICAVRFAADERTLVEELRTQFPAATLSPDPEGLRAVLEDVRARAAGGRGKAPPLDLQGTAFQKEVWAALQRIPRGQTASYRDIARALGRPAAVRAVAGAIAANPAAVVVPCHRVLRADGGLGGFRWGLARKRKLLAAEARKTP